MHKLIKAENLSEFLEGITANKLDLEYLPTRHKLTIYQEGNRVGGLRLPLNYTWEPKSGKICPRETNWILFMVRAGIASVGYFENGINLSHNVYRAYMVRKNKGKVR